MNEKSISLIVPGGAQDEVRHIPVNEGTTIEKLLDEQNLRDYQLSLGPGKPFLASKDTLFDRVKPGDKVYATTKAQQG